MPLGVYLDIIWIDHVTIPASFLTFANGAKPSLHDQHNEHADKEVTSQCHHIAAHIGHLIALKGDIGPHRKAGQSILVGALGKSSTGASRSSIENLSWSVLSSLIQELLARRIEHTRRQGVRREDLHDVVNQVCQILSRLNQTKDEHSR